MPKFSVIIPVYNVEKYIRECLESLVNQTLKDIEFICVNDGSTDSSLDILNEYAKNDSRFVIINQHNQGQGVARNNALAAAKGEYVAFVDPDDWVETNMFEELYLKFKETNVDVIQFNFKVCFEKSGEIKYKNYSAKLDKRYNLNLKKFPYYNWRDIREGCFIANGLAVWHRVYSLSFLRSNDVKFSEGKVGEDNLFAIMTVMLADKIYYVTNKYFYNYRVRVGSAINSFSKDNFNVFNNINAVKQFLISNNFLPELNLVFERYVFDELVAAYRRIPHESVEEYEKKCQELLTEEKFKKLKRAFLGECSFAEQIFSIKNLYKHGVKYKIVTILGFKFEFK